MKMDRGGFMQNFNPYIFMKPPSDDVKNNQDKEILFVKR